jgi:hypothetical protein
MKLPPARPDEAARALACGRSREADASPAGNVSHAENRRWGSGLAAAARLGHGVGDRTCVGCDASARD